MGSGPSAVGVPETLRHVRQLAEHIADVAYIAGPDRLITWVAPTVEPTLGWTPQELIGTRFVDLIHPDDVPSIAAQREQMYNGRPMHNYVEGVPMRLRSKAGEYRWFSGRGVPLFDDDGQPIGLAAGLRLVDDLVHERERAKASEEHVEHILDSMLDPHLMLRAVRDEDGNLRDMEYSRANAVACEVLHLKREDLIGKRVLEWLPGMAQDELWRLAVSALETGEPLVWDDYRFPVSVLKRERFYDIRMVRLDDQLSCSFRDVTSRQRAARAIAESESRFRLLAENTSDVVITVGGSGAIEWVSPAARVALGRTVVSLLGTQFSDLVHPDDLPALESLGSAEVRLGSPVDRWRWMRMTSRVLPDVTIYTARDIQAEMHARAQLAHEIGHDPLTGLPNRSEALVQMEEALDTAPKGSLALLAIGVDDLRSLNEAFTYSAGDQVLTQIGTRLLHLAEHPEDVARVGDSEFTLMVHGVTDAAALADLVTTMQADLRSAVQIDAHSIEVTVSIGIAIAGTLRASELLRDATSAMHHARRSGGNRWQYHDPGLTETARERLIMRTGIREALQSQQFQPWFQPVVSMADGRVRGYEALARWVRDGRIIPPADFVPVAESTDLIIAIDRFILHKALAQMPPGVEVSVNVSAATLSSVDLAESVHAELAASGFDPSRLNLEVTETALLQPTALVKDNMQQVANLGARWWVDDFGTGYSSITHLRDLPIHGLKLDRSFTAGLPDDATCQRLALGLVGLARGLGLNTIAEGVETRDQAQMLAAQGWDMGQGWLYGKPRPF